MICRPSILARFGGSIYAEGCEYVVKTYSRISRTDFGFDSQDSTRRYTNRPSKTPNIYPSLHPLQDTVSKMNTINVEVRMWRWLP